MGGSPSSRPSAPRRPDPRLGESRRGHRSHCVARGAGASAAQGLHAAHVRVQRAGAQGLRRPAVETIQTVRSETGSPCRSSQAPWPTKSMGTTNHATASVVNHATHTAVNYYWIIWSARSNTDGGIARPSAFAVLRLITSSNLVGCSTGKSAGLAPLSILSA